MVQRSSLPETRNPMLRLPAVRRMSRLPNWALRELSEALTELSADARERAEESWRKHKAPMAAYWKAVAVYARYLRLAIRSPQRLERS